MSSYHVGGVVGSKRSGHDDMVLLSQVRSFIFYFQWREVRLGVKCINGRKTTTLGLHSYDVEDTPLQQSIFKYIYIYSASSIHNTILGV